MASILIVVDRCKGQVWSIIEVSVQKDTLVKSIAVREINRVEPGELIHTILEKGIDEYGFYE